MRIELSRTISQHDRRSLGFPGVAHSSRNSHPTKCWRTSASSLARYSQEAQAPSRAQSTRRKPKGSPCRNGKHLHCEMAWDTVIDRILWWRYCCWYRLSLFLAGAGADLRRAEELYQRTEYRSALNILLPLSPKHAAVYALIGKTYYMEGQYKSSTTYFEKAVAEDSLNSGYYDWFGKQMVDALNSPACLRHRHTRERRESPSRKPRL